MSSRERPHDSWSRILQPRPIAAGRDGAGGHPVWPGDNLGVLEIVRTFETKLGGVAATTGGDRQSDVASVATETIEQREELQSIHQAESNRRPGGGRLNQNRDR